MSYHALQEPLASSVDVACTDVVVPVGAEGKAQAASPSPSTNPAVFTQAGPPAVPNARDEVMRILAAHHANRSGNQLKLLLIGLLFVGMTIVGWVMYSWGKTTTRWDSTTYTYRDQWDTERAVGLALGITGAILTTLIYTSICCVTLCRAGATKRLQDDAALLTQYGSHTQQQTNFMTWRLSQEQWERWVSSNFGGCARGVCYCCFRSTLQKANSKRHGAVMVLSRSGMFFDDVRELLLASNVQPVHVERVEVRADGAVEQALLVHCITETFDKRGPKYIHSKCTMWLPHGTPPPHIAAQQPGGDQWLHWARAILPLNPQLARYMRR